MTSHSGSFRLADFDSSTLATLRSTTSRRISSTDDSSSSLPGLETAARVAQALTRPATPTRSVAEERHEEQINAFTHGLGLMVSLVGFGMLLTTASATGMLSLASSGVYGLSLVLMYAASTSLHVAECPKQKLRFQVCDHVSIYLLIAGTYTPFLLALPGYLGVTLLGCVWALAAIGISIKLKYSDRLEETSPLPYVGLGWLILAAIKPLMTVLPAGAMVLLVAGGIAYSAGVPFYCRDDKRYFHAIWHLFVMVGTVCHFAAVMMFVGN